MPDERKKTPTYEDIERELGIDKMSFMSEMLRPDQHEEREEEAAAPPERPDLAGLTSDERNLIRLLEWDAGRKFTPQEIKLSLRQAHEIGEL